MAINLDSLFADDSDPKETKTQEQTPKQPATTPTSGEELGIVLVPKAPGNKGKTAMPALSRSVSDLYQEGQKLIYLLDRSSSMCEPISGHRGSVDWQKAVPVIKAALLETFGKMLQIEAGATSDVVSFTRRDERLADLIGQMERGTELRKTNEDGTAVLDLDSMEPMMLAKVAELHGVQYFMELPRPDEAYDFTPKMDVLKKASKSMVEERRSKYPEANIEVIFFNTEIRHGQNLTTDGLVRDIQKTEAAGGTRILTAIKYALEVCHARPSSVNLHHIVLVSDGEDGSALDVPDLVPQMKKMGVVLDFIFMGQAVNVDDPCVAALKRASEATGGTFTIVGTAKDFEEKFIQASTRALLPPAPSK